MRADHVGALGGLPGLTPELDRFAAEADLHGARRWPASSNAAGGAGFAVHRHRRPAAPGARPPARRAAPGPAHPRRAFLARKATTPSSSSRGRPGSGATDCSAAWPAPKASPRSRRCTSCRSSTPCPASTGSSCRRPTPPTSTAAPNCPAARPGRRRPAASLGGEDLLPYADPARPLPPELQRAVAELFRIETAAGDARFGRLLAGLRAARPGTTRWWW